MSRLLSLDDAIDYLSNEQVIAYPTESIFGLGCDPDSEKAVMELLTLKQRPIEKGLILIADNYQQLMPYIDDSHLTTEQKERIFSSWPGPVTWVFPKHKNTPYYLTGQFNSLAVRVTNHPVVKSLCYQYGKPLVSTSANISGCEPCKSETEINQQFGYNFPILSGQLGGRNTPSQIRDALSGEIIRL